MGDVYKVPILLILFNRPKYISKTIQYLNIIKPEALYVHIDGPRNQEDQDKINKVEVMLKELHNDINVTVKKSNSNLGCGLGPVSAINWFFENEDYGIIFEDDVTIEVIMFESSDVKESRVVDFDSLKVVSWNIRNGFGRFPWIYDSCGDSVISDESSIKNVLSN